MKGGLATSDEMCLSFLVYYPRAEVVRCLSGPTAEAGELFFAKLKYVSRRYNVQSMNNVVVHSKLCAVHGCHYVYLLTEINGSNHWIIPT